jgi:hypothetical protein
MAKKYVKMYHIDKLFPHTMKELNYNFFGIKPGKSISKHFAHIAMKGWSVLYYVKTFSV